MRLLKLTIVLILLEAWIQCPPLAAFERYEYIETTGSLKSFLTWEIDRDNETVIRVRQGKRAFFNYCDRSGATLRWKYKSCHTDIHVKRQGNALSVSGIYDGKVLKRHLRLDDSPWYQPLSYSLREFLASDRSSVVFWIVRSDNLKAIKLKAVKERIEGVRIGDDLIEAQRIKVSPVGLYSWIWSGTYWYRLSDRVFVKYKGTIGIPGMPETIVELRPPEMPAN